MEDLKRLSDRILCIPSWQLPKQATTIQVGLQDENSHFSLFSVDVRNLLFTTFVSLCRDSDNDRLIFECSNLIKEIKHIMIEIVEQVVVPTSAVELRTHLIEKGIKLKSLFQLYEIGKKITTWWTFLRLHIQNTKMEQLTDPKESPIPVMIELFSKIIQIHEEMENNESIQKTISAMKGNTAKQDHLRFLFPPKDFTQCIRFFRAQNPFLRIIVTGEIHKELTYFLAFILNSFLSISEPLTEKQFLFICHSIIALDRWEKDGIWHQNSILNIKEIVHLLLNYPQDDPIFLLGIKIIYMKSSNLKGNPSNRSFQMKFSSILT